MKRYVRRISFLHDEEIRTVKFFASDWIQSKTTWNGIAAILSTITVELCKRPDLLPVVMAIHGALATIFIRDTLAKHIDATNDLKQQIAMSRNMPAEDVQAIADEFAAVLQNSATGISAADTKELISDLTEKLANSTPVGTPAMIPGKPLPQPLVPRDFGSGNFEAGISTAAVPKVKPEPSAEREEKMGSDQLSFLESRIKESIQEGFKKMQERNKAESSPAQEAPVQVSSPLPNAPPVRLP